VTDYQTTTEIIQRARSVLAPPVWDYIAGGAETEMTIRRNRAAIDGYAFRARVMRDVSSIDTSTTLLGTALRIPFIAAPLGGLQEVHPDGAAAVVRGALTFGTLPVISSVTLPVLEECAAAAAGDKWFQLYVRGDDEWVMEMAARARAAGYTGFVITADTAHYSNRERQKIARYLPESRRVAPGGEGFQAALDWRVIRRLKAESGLPIVLKGVQAAEDATLALEYGVDVVWVSNHGGRQLDHAVGSLDVLVEVVAAIGGRVPIVVDGGFLRGTDVLKAIALGATAVAGGRLTALALGAGGEAAIRRAYEILAYEITTSMGLLGVTSLAQLDASYVKAVGQVSNPGPFPHLDRGLHEH
jgi:isopentenyl diphosphate isomerase/L-lactate dehydrogenase-like FMN-dependent dehydrogenase